jgi:very-short-patch-repair endonuclease
MFIVSLPLEGRDKGWGNMTIKRARELRKNMPEPEAMLWDALREIKPLGFHFRRQVPLGPYHADFASHRAKLVIEVDGDSHAESEMRDARRDAYLGSLGFEVLRVSNADVSQNLDGVMRAVLDTLERRDGLGRKDV